MKKAGYCLIIFTLIFTGFLCGFLFGRNYNSGDVQLSGKITEATPVPSDPTDLPEQNEGGIENARVNINAAAVEEISALPGIGPVLAQRIVDYRKQNGAFRSVAELTNVSGIGEKKLEAIKQYIFIGVSK